MIKNIYTTCLVVFFISFFTVPVSPVYAQTVGDVDHILVRTAHNDVGILKNIPALRDIGWLDSLGVYRAAIDQEITDDIIKKLRYTPGILLAEKDFQTQAQILTPNDTYYSQQYYISELGIDKAWDITGGSPSVVVAVIDSGIDYNHEDLRGMLWKDAQGNKGYDFVNHDTDPMDDFPHGTAVSGIIAATAGNIRGIAGIAQVKLMALKVLDQEGVGDVSTMAQAIRYAANNGADVINISVGFVDTSTVLTEAIDYAYNKGLFIVGAAGNGQDEDGDGVYEGVSEITDPARHPKIVAVGSLTQNGTRSTFSNYGADLDLMVPGERILSAELALNGLSLYSYNGGTSFAAPQVSGIAALILSKDPSLSPDQIKKRIFNTTTQLPAAAGELHSIEYGYGKPDAYKALTYDITKPKIQAQLYQLGANKYQVIGTAVDTAQSGKVVAFDAIADSNIQTVRYAIDGGTWQTTSSIAQPIATLNARTAELATGEHTITVEVVDTSGNSASAAFSTSNSVVGSISSSPQSYRAELVSQSSYPYIVSGTTVAVSLAFRNTGSSVWTKDTVRLGTNNPRDRVSIFKDDSWLSNSRIEMNEVLIAPGGIAHFDFSFTAPTNLKGVFSEYFNLVAEGVAWFPDIGLFWKVTVEPPSYHAQYLRQSPYIITTPGSTISMLAEFKNTGTQTWEGGNVHLGTSNPLDRVSAFYNPSPTSGWKSNNRIGMTTRSVAPGDTAQFSFVIQAPTTRGIYKEYFRPVADGVGWMEDYGMYWIVEVR